MNKHDFKDRVRAEHDDRRDGHGTLINDGQQDLIRYAHAKAEYAFKDRDMWGAVKNDHENVRPEFKPVPVSGLTTHSVK